MAAPLTPAPAGGLPEPAAPPPAPPKVHRRRFLVLYAVLAALLAVGAATGVHMLTRHVPTPKPWSSWAPPSSDPESAVREIASHVQGAYLGPDGKEIATVRGGPLSVGSDPAVLVKPDSTAAGGYKFFDGASVEYQLCGTTTKGNCRIDETKIVPNTAGALTRRMAYELALMTFHYVPSVQNVAVLLPAVIKGQKARMLVLTKADGGTDPKSLVQAIGPIRKVGKPTSAEALAIAKETDPLIFHYEVTATSDNQPVYLITPILIKDTAAAASSVQKGSSSP